MRAVWAALWPTLYLLGLILWYAILGGVIMFVVLWWATQYMA